MPEERWEETQVLNHCTLSENIAGDVDSCLKQSIYWTPYLDCLKIWLIGMWIFLLHVSYQNYFHSTQ